MSFVNCKNISNNLKCDNWYWGYFYSTWKWRNLLSSVIHDCHFTNTDEKDKKMQIYDYFQLHVMKTVETLITTVWMEMTKRIVKWTTFYKKKMPRNSVEDYEVARFGSHSRGWLQNSQPTNLLTFKQHIVCILQSNPPIYKYV